MCVCVSNTTHVSELCNYIQTQYLLCCQPLPNVVLLQMQVTDCIVENSTMIMK